MSNQPPAYEDVTQSPPSTPAPTPATVIRQPVPGNVVMPSEALNPREPGTEANESGNEKKAKRGWNPWLITGLVFLVVVLAPAAGVVGSQLSAPR